MAVTRNPNIDKLASILRQIVRAPHRAPQLIGDLIFRITRRLVRVNLVLRKEIEASSTPYHVRMPVEISVASEREVEEAARLQNRPGWVEVYRSRRRRGHKCFVAKTGGAVIASNWLFFGAEVERADFTALCEGEVWCSDAYTEPSWRGYGIHTGLLSRMIQWADAAGYRIAYTDIVAYNRDSWITHYRLGWKLVQVVIRLRLGRTKRETIWVFGGSSHPLRGIFSHWRMEARHLLLRRLTDRLPTSAPWFCSRVSRVGRTDIFIIDPAWEAELLQAGTLIHLTVTAALARGARSARNRKPHQVTVLLGDVVMNSHLHNRAWGHAADVAMQCFAEAPAIFSRRRSKTICLGCIALAREALSREAENARIPLSLHIASVVIDATLTLLGYVDGAARAQLADAIKTDLELGDTCFGSSPAIS
jgi:GNAT superfamily N-acetyltransferase/ssRNA-specific RNase YbeY (16S rRNA maturation enzyme)